MARKRRYNRRKRRTYRRRSVYRRRYRRRTAKIRSRRIGKRLGYYKPSGGFNNVPNGTIMKIKYLLPTQVLFSNPTGGSTTQYIFRGNSIYDPDQTTGIGSTSAYQMQQMVTDYSAYRVYGSKIRCTMKTNASGAGEGTNSFAHLYLFPAAGDSGNAPLSITSQGQCEMMPYKKKRVSFQSSNVGVTFTPNEWTLDVSMKHYMKTKKLIRNADQNDISGLTGGFGTGTNPNFQWYWHLVYCAPAGSAAWSVIGTVSITYYTLFFDRKPIVGGQTTFT